MGEIDYKKLYQLQDKVLDVVFECEREFYLTGGTCLSRFYHPKRYSDDLDFFTNDSKRYPFAVKNIKKALSKEFDVSTEVESKSFTRFKIDQILQLDFVNDIPYRYKDVKIHNNYLIDNIENILSNKLTAIIGRDNPKDIFDLFLISNYYLFSWEDILEASHKKAGFEDSDLLVRLKSFPKEMLKDIKLIDKTFLDDFDIKYPLVIEEIANKTNHVAFKNKI